MFLENYCQTDNDKVSFTRQQASDFAKNVADDFNPLHDVDAKRFCVPGDLLFALTLETSGLSQQMAFNFSGMVTDGIALNFPRTINETSVICDDNGKEYLSVTATGTSTKDKQAINALITAYVEFSGHTFPHILVSLMAENEVMINPTRPMVMYESMSIELDTVEFTDLTLELAESKLSLDGKRGVADLIFNLYSAGKQIGCGKKHMILSGLRPFEQAVMDDVVQGYIDKKANYFAA